MYRILVLTLAQGTVFSSLPPGENGLDEDTHHSSWRVSATNNAETQRWAARSLPEHQSMP